jgi:hypothetical protein
MLMAKQVRRELKYECTKAIDSKEKREESKI